MRKSNRTKKAVLARVGLATLANFALAASVLPTGTALAVTQTYDGAAGAFNIDSWNLAARWNSSLGPVPSGTDDVVIAASKVAWAANAKGSYSGNLTLKTNATLGRRWPTTSSMRLVITSTRERLRWNRAL